MSRKQEKAKTNRANIRISNSIVTTQDSEYAEKIHKIKTHTDAASDAHAIRKVIDYYCSAIFGISQQ